MKSRRGGRVNLLGVWKKGSGQSSRGRSSGEEWLSDLVSVEEGIEWRVESA